MSHLAPYAVTEENTRGRDFTQPRHSYRDPFQRDRDRVIHCEAFRRLEGKTQVFTPGIIDSYRNRLTHSIEVAQIGRTIAKQLNLNETLTEAICLAHDLGHSPFGHAGESALNSIMAEFGGFEHNRQTLRIVELIEHPYPDFAGLNLMYETRLGLAKHSSPYDKSYSTVFPETSCTLEGRIADIADRIAYNCHDLEDGMRARIITEEQLTGYELFQQATDRINAGRIEDRTVRRVRTAKAIIELLVSDCLTTSAEKIKGKKPESLADILNCPDQLITFSPAVDENLKKLEAFLLAEFYNHPQVMETTLKVNGWLSGLFTKLIQKPELMPSYFRKLADDHGLQRTVCDYIAGMTDRYCLRQIDEKT